LNIKTKYAWYNRVTIPTQPRNVKADCGALFRGKVTEKFRAQL